MSSSTGLLSRHQNQFIPSYRDFAAYLAVNAEFLARKPPVGFLALGGYDNWVIERENYWRLCRSHDEEHERRDLINAMGRMWNEMLEEVVRRHCFDCEDDCWKYLSKCAKGAYWASRREPSYRRRFIGSCRLLAILTLHTTACDFIGSYFIDEHAISFDQLQEVAHILLRLEGGAASVAELLNQVPIYFDKKLSHTKFRNLVSRPAGLPQSGRPSGGGRPRQLPKKHNVQEAFNLRRKQWQMD